MPLRIAYLLDRPELGGGVKVVFQHAALLAGRGHRVYVAARGPRPDWAAEATGSVGSPGSVLYLDHGHLAEGVPPELPEPVDLVVATYWTTLLPARRAVEAGHAATAVHLCQGFEPDWPHQRHRAEAIEEAYAAADLPALVVAPHLGKRLEDRFGLSWRLAPPPLDPRFRPTLRLRPRRRPWVAVPGIFEARVKGVPVALDAVRRLEEAGRPCRLLRVSVLPPTPEEEGLRRADRFLHGVPPQRVAAELRRCDLLLFPARAGEGFGLPLLEALASGVPAVASRLPPTEFLTGGAVPLVPPDDPAALAGEAERLLASAAAWRRVRRDALRRVRRFEAPVIAVEVEAAVRWATAAGEGGADPPRAGAVSPAGGKG